MVLSPEHLEVLAQSLTAVLGIWLGLTVLSRSGAPGARIFSFVSLAIVVWSSSVVLQRLSTSVSAVHVGKAVEELSAALIVPATAHLSLVIATEGHPWRRQVRTLALAYVSNVLFALPGIFDPSAPIAISPPQLTLGPVPGAVLGWIWIATRLATLLIAAGWLLRAYLAARPEDPRRRQLRVALATVAVGAVGGIIRLLSVVGQTDPWIGVSLVTLAMILAASVVFSGRLFFAPEVAGRAFWTSLALGLGLSLLVGALLIIDAASRRLLGVDLPLAPILTIVLIIALGEPALAWSRARLGARSPGDIARGRLLTALGQPAFTAQAADAGVRPALSRVSQALDLDGAVVIRQDGSVAAAEGSAPDPATAPAIPLISGDELMGQLRVGRTLSGDPLSHRDEEILRLSAAYVAAALRTVRREDEQAAALSGLTVERANVESSGTRLFDALVQRTQSLDGLRVFALGPLRVERGDLAIQRWGGEKAGSRQAHALFAFLFDRGERGVAKDEALELIWPDTDTERADLAFHRTLGGLRHTLDPGAGGKRTIKFYNDRYRLDPQVIGWSDVAVFLGRLDDVRVANDRTGSIRLLEEARALYRGDYLDDCPFYGDSVYVEDRRAALRGRAIDLLVALGAAYEATGDRASASVAYREAIAVAVDGCAEADAGLTRLASSA